MYKSPGTFVSNETTRTGDTDNAGASEKSSLLNKNKQQRPLKIFPLLKELGSGWKNLQVSEYSNEYSRFSSFELLLQNHQEGKKQTHT